MLSAYNRSGVMRCAIESVLRQTVTDWELLVVCDACTDDSEHVASGFSDPRLQFVNLAQNHGEQSGPNNAGFERSRGEFIAFLNQDDLWFPDHLERALQALEETGADMVFTLAARIRPDGKELLGVAPKGRFERYVFAPASTLVFRRRTLEEAGPWRDYRELYFHPTRDLLLRTRALGKQMRLVPHVTVVALPAGLRPGVYRHAGATENERYLARMADADGLRAELLEEIALGYAGPMLYGSGWRMALGAAGRLVRDGLTLAGVDAWSVLSMLRYGPRRGAGVASRRRFKGLD